MSKTERILTRAEIPSDIKEFVIPDGVTKIDDMAFLDCSGLTSVTIPEGVTSIGSWAFLKCEGLTSITIPSSVTSIGSCAFRCCSSLTSVEIPSSVTSIGYGAFDDCENLIIRTPKGSHASKYAKKYNIPVKIVERADFSE